MAATPLAIPPPEPLAVLPLKVQLATEEVLAKLFIPISKHPRMLLKTDGGGQGLHPGQSEASPEMRASAPDLKTLPIIFGKSGGPS